MNLDLELTEWDREIGSWNLETLRLNYKILYIAFLKLRNDHDGAEKALQSIRLSHIQGTPYVDPRKRKKD